MSARLILYGIICLWYLVKYLFNPANFIQEHLVTGYSFLDNVIYWVAIGSVSLVEGIMVILNLSLVHAICVNIQNRAHLLVDKVKRVVNPLGLWRQLTMSPANSGSQMLAHVMDTHHIPVLINHLPHAFNPLVHACLTKSIHVQECPSKHNPITIALQRTYKHNWPVVVLIQCGPNMDKFLDALNNKFVQTTPFILICVRPAFFIAQSINQHEKDQLMRLQQLTKYSTRVQKIRTIIPKFRKAFRQAVSGVVGPVLIEMPKHLLHSYDWTRKAMLDSYGCNQVPQHVHNQLKHMFRSLAFDLSVDCSMLKLRTALPSERLVTHIRNQLLKFRQCVIILGPQAIMVPLSTIVLFPIFFSHGIQFMVDHVLDGLQFGSGLQNIGPFDPARVHNKNIAIFAGTDSECRLYEQFPAPPRIIVKVNQDSQQLAQFVKHCPILTVPVRSDVALFFRELMVHPELIPN